VIEIQCGTSLSVQIVRRKFEARLKKWKDCAEKMQFVLRSEIATPAEKQTARNYLLKLGWNEQQVEAIHRCFPHRRVGTRSREKARSMSAHFIDLTGQTFGLLTVRERAGANEARHSLWRCECRCGEFITARGSNLTECMKRRCGPKCKFQKERPVFRVTTIDGRAGESTRFGKQ